MGKHQEEEKVEWYKIDADKKESKKGMRTGEKETEIICIVGKWS